MRDFEYLEPNTVAEACGLLQRFLFPLMRAFGFGALHGNGSFLSRSFSWTTTRLASPMTRF